MKIKRGIVFFALFVFLSVVSTIIYSQIPVETSKEKVIISGNQYFIHTVKKGQTVYSISKAYGISVQDLTAENPPSLYGLKEGQVLRIPATGSGPQPLVAVPTVISNKDESKFTYHSLKAGETIYSLSRLYGVSETEIMQSNPGIEINKLTVGSEIAIPKRDFMTRKEKFSDQEKKYIYHKVENGETLASIAEKYGITLRELRKENKNLRFPKVGDYVKVPAAVLPESQTEKQLQEERIDEIPAETIVEPVRPVGFTPVTNLNGSINVAVLLPFYLNDNSERVMIDSVIVKGRKQYKYSERPGDWIYPLSLDFVEMYNGILLAADTLRSLGLNVNLQTYDIRQDTVAMSRLIQSGKLSDIDLIIGPVFSTNLRIVSRYAGNLGIPVISPVPLISNSVLSGNPTLFMTNSSIDVAQKILAKEISSYNNSNLVFIHTDSTGRDPDVRNYKKHIFNELTGKMPYEDIRFRELIFYPRSAFGNDSINRISHSLSENIQNVVIIASEDQAVVSEIMTIVHGLYKKFDIKVFGYPSMIYIENLDPKVFFDMNQLIFSPYKIDYTAKNVKAFNIDYFKKFLTMPMETSYAWIGYDICYYFLSGVAMHGKQFIEHPEIHNPELLQNKFEFERENSEDGFENQKLFKIRYSRDYDIIIEE
ncbi:MAG TPA: LysM peptidoglycan-binding domain-containing protein [Bacteroidales bacterium]|nr:LysM peptidoglycan-binding domain-containing protein [Bacteroidales bacterium]